MKLLEGRDTSRDHETLQFLLFPVNVMGATQSDGRCSPAERNRCSRITGSWNTRKGRREELEGCTAQAFPGTQDAPEGGTIGADEW